MRSSLLERFPILLPVTALALAVTFGDLLSGDRVPAYRDLLPFVVPLRHFLAESLREGDLPLWSPWIRLGTPFLASLYSSVLYPPNALLLIQFPIGFNLFLLVHYVIAVGGAFAFLRDRRLGVVAAVFGSLVFALGGYLVSMLNTTTHLQSAAWAPWVLYFWQRFLRDRSPLFLAATAAAVTLQLLGGGAEVLLLTLLLAAVWTGYRSLPDWRLAGRVGTAFCATVALAMALGAAQILPTAEIILRSTRAEALSFEEVSYWSLQPISILQLLFPHSSAFEPSGGMGPVLERHLPWIHSIYVGVVGLCLSIAGVCFGRERRFWGGMLLAAFALALARDLPFLRILYDLAPEVVGKFRYPEKFLFVAHISAMVLAAEGGELLIRRHVGATRVIIVAAVSFLAIGCAAQALAAQPQTLLDVVAILIGGERPPPAALIATASDLVFKSERLVMISGALAALLWMSRQALVGPSIVHFLVLALLTTDLASIHRNLNLSTSWSALRQQELLVDADRLRPARQRIFHYQTTSWGPPSVEGRTIPGLRPLLWQIDSTEPAHSARARWAALSMDTGVMYGVGNLSGTDSITQQSDFVLDRVLPILPRTKAVDLLRVYGVAYLIGTAPLEVQNVEPVDGHTAWGFYVYRVLNPLPAAYLVSSVHVATKEIDVLNRLIAPAFRANHEAVVDRLPSGWSNSGQSESPGEILERSFSNEQITFRVRAARPALLVLNDTYFPGWEARIDGRTVEILRTNLLSRGVAIEPGEHEVEFVYSPRSFRVGTWISLTGGLVFAALVASRLRERGRASLPARLARAWP